MVRRGKGESSARRKGLIAACAAIVTGLFLFAVAPVVGDGLNSSPAPAPIVIATTHPATSAQIAATRGMNGASASRVTRKGKVRTVLRRITLRPLVTNQEFLTEEGKGTFVGIPCPAGSKAISGGVLSKYINLLVSSSAPNHPLTGAYTPNKWWLTVTNVNVDGNGGTLPWRGVVNCISPVRLVTG